MFEALFPRKHWPDGRPMSSAEESAHWIVTCSSCGWTSNVAAMGGTRYRARGTKRSRRTCPGCHDRQWLIVTWHAPT